MRASKKSVINFVSEQDEESRMDGRGSEGVGEADGGVEMENGKELKRKFVAMEEENTGLKERVKLLEEQMRVKVGALEQMRMAKLESKTVITADPHQRPPITPSAVESEGEEARWRDKNPEFYEHDYNNDVKEEVEDEEDSAEETDGDSDGDVEVLKTAAKMLSSGPGLLRPYTVEEGRTLGRKLRGLGRKLKNLKKCQQVFYLKKVGSRELREHLKFWESRCVARKGDMDRLQSAHAMAMDKMKQEFQVEMEMKIRAAEAEVRKSLTVDQWPRMNPAVAEVTVQNESTGALPIISKPRSLVEDVCQMGGVELLDDEEGDSIHEVDRRDSEYLDGTGEADLTTNPVPGSSYSLRRTASERSTENEEESERELEDVIDEEYDSQPPSNEKSAVGRRSFRRQHQPSQSSERDVVMKTTTAPPRSHTGDGDESHSRGRSKVAESVVAPGNNSKSDKKQFRCSRCGSTFTLKYDLNRHVKNVHERVRGQFPCSVCEKRFQDRTHLQRHMGTHDPNRIRDFVCPTCSSAFSTSDGLARHERLHRQDTPFKCPHCPSQLKLAERLTKHLRVHSERRSFQCQLCEKSFKRSEELVVHTRVHTGERPYSCHVCKKAFSVLNTLKDHLRTHQGDEGRIHQCPFCDLKFVHKKTWQRHQERLHISELEPRKDDNTASGE